jgi:hypothetical protein
LEALPRQAIGFDEGKSMPAREHEVDQRHRAKAARNREATGKAKIICECADLRCNATLVATAADYAKRSRGAHGFWVRPGHEIGGLEQVVEQNDDYAIVQKLAARPAYIVSTR